MFATEKATSIPQADADRDTLLQFCRDNDIEHHHRHGSEKLWSRILAWQATHRKRQPQPRREGIHTLHRGTVDWAKDTSVADEERLSAQRAILRLNRQSTPDTGIVRKYIQRLEEQVLALTTE